MVASLKKALITLPLLPLPRTKGQYILATDGCDKQIGCAPLRNRKTETTALWATVVVH